MSTFWSPSMANIFKLQEHRLHFEHRSPISHVMTTELFIINWCIDQLYFSPLPFWKHPTATHSCRGFEDAPDARCDHTTRHVVRSDVLLRKSTMMPSQHRDLGTYLRAWTSPPAAARAHNWGHKSQNRADHGVIGQVVRHGPRICKSPESADRIFCPGSGQRYLYSL